MNDYHLILSRAFMTEAIKMTKFPGKGRMENGYTKKREDGKERSSLGKDGFFVFLKVLIIDHLNVAWLVVGQSDNRKLLVLGLKWYICINLSVIWLYQSGSCMIVSFWHLYDCIILAVIWLYHSGSDMIVSNLAVIWLHQSGRDRIVSNLEVIWLYQSGSDMIVSNLAVIWLYQSGSEMILSMCMSLFCRAVNVRNRQMNWINAVIAGKIEYEEKKNATADPFTRRRCVPTMVTKVSIRSVRQSIRILFSSYICLPPFIFDAQLGLDICSIWSAFTCPRILPIQVQAAD